MENIEKMDLQSLKLLKVYLSQSSTKNEFLGFGHDNGHDNSGGHPDYHNDSHDNTPGMKFNVRNENSISIKR